MAFEARRKKNYYYRKKRVGSRVVSEYVGKGEFADYLAKFDKYNRLKQRIEAQKTREMREKLEEIDREIDEIGEINRNLVDMLFLINGYYEHKRQWRKKRKK
jgi:wobble nucleotide-excising tRNase